MQNVAKEAAPCVWFAMLQATEWQRIGNQINAALGGAGDIESAAYLNSYNPTNLCQNYLGDTGVVGLGTTIPTVSYSFTVPARSDFVVVVNTTGTTTSSQFSGTVSGFFDDTPGPGACPTGSNCAQGFAR